MSTRVRFDDVIFARLCAKVNLSRVNLLERLIDLTLAYINQCAVAPPQLRMSRSVKPDLRGVGVDTVRSS